MWPFSRLSARQKEIRRARAERRTALWTRIGEQLQARPAAIVLFSAVTAAVLVNSGRDPLPYHAGEHVPRAITSRVDFRVPDPQRTIAMRARARDTAPNYYVLDTSLVEDVRGRLSNALRIALESAGDLEKIRKAAAEIQIDVDEAGAAELARLAALPDPAEFTSAVERAMQLLARQPLVEAMSKDEPGYRPTAPAAVLVIAEPASSREAPVAQLIFPSDPEAGDKAAGATAAALPGPLRPSVRRSIATILRTEGGAYKPLYRYDPTRSEEAARRAELAVEQQFVAYARGSRLTDAGEIAPDELALLAQESQAHETALREDPRRLASERWAEFSRGALALLLVAGLGGHVVLRQRGTQSRLVRSATTALALLGVVALTRFLFVYTGEAYPAIGAQALAAMLLAIVFPLGSVYAVTGLIALLLALVTRQSVEFLLTLLAVSITLLAGLRDIRNRGKIIAVGAVAAAAALATTTLTGIVDGQALSYILRQSAAGAAATTLAAAFLVEGILPAIERIWRLSTSMTLLEWCDANKPLLRTMAADAPGTYNHSLLVGALAEAAAESIGARGLLARTGAYYHDVGKTRKPEYFVENQGSGVSSRHERLSPAMSLLIIVNHVKDGIEMAREYALPASLHPFIAEHHGTTLVEYFYHAATRARRPSDAEVSESDYRYPGPKPQSRETAIVMICDAVEGAVRAMAEPTPGRIEDTVDKIIQKRLIDGQFDECDLTFRDLRTIRDSVVKSLCSIYHGRIVYPASEEETTTAMPRSAS